MLASPEDRTPSDLNRVSLNEEWEVQWWCTKFGITEGELRSWVAEVGPDAASVERRLHDAGKAAFRNTGES